MTGRHDTPPHLGGKSAVVVFVFTLVAYVSESELTQYVQTTLGYRQPYFIFYLAHSALSLIFPLHLLYLSVTTNYNPRALLSGVAIAVTRQLSQSGRTAVAYSSPSLRLAASASLPLILVLTLGLTVPALMWFAAISMSSVSDVTAIWNTNALWCWVFTVWFFKLQWEYRPLFAVLLATVGVFIVVYGGSESPESSPDSASVETSVRILRPTAPVIGDVMTLAASLLYGLYQVLYKKYAALPSEAEVPLDSLYEHISDENDDLRPVLDGAAYPPPFGFHPNFLTSGIGLCTLLILWIPIPFLHYFNIEHFSLPTDIRTVWALAGLSLSGLVFNAGFMALLGLWGPIIISVGNLLTIVLVLFIDVLFGGGADTLTFWSLLGSGVIISAFSVLAYDMFRGQ